MKTIKLIPMLLFFTFALFAQSGDLKNEPGYIDFGDFSAFETSTGVPKLFLKKIFFPHSHNYQVKRIPTLWQS